MIISKIRIGPNNINQRVANIKLEKKKKFYQRMFLTLKMKVNASHILQTHGL